MALHWAQLRTWNGSQQHAFEELCAQIAASESTPAESRFFRKGTPDAGVECYWQLPNGDEWAWQAKFFLNSPSRVQWNQIDKSVKTALQKHPRLAKFIVCLPVDLPDGKRKGKKSAFDKWCDYVCKWEKLATKKGMSVSFEYWGQSELGGRLSDEQHRGRLWFWFNDEHLGDSWFISRVSEAVENARDRYSPELNIDPVIRSTFDSLGRTPAFFSKLTKFYSEIRIKYKKLRPLPTGKTQDAQYEKIAKVAEELLNKIAPWCVNESEFAEWSVSRSIPTQDISWLSKQLAEDVRSRISSLFDKRDRPNADPKAKTKTSVREAVDHEIYELRNLLQVAFDLAEYSAGSELGLSNRPAMLLAGAAGQGKTHLLCDVARQDATASRPRIILHGEQFHNAEPWSQIVRLVGLNCSRDEFVGALESAAQAKNCRSLIFIDALNEGDGNRLWHKFLPGILTTIAQSPWIGICVSVRSSYEQHIIPETLDDSRIVRIEHSGFEGLAYDATTKFFRHFDVEPSTPLLLPEFNNPLFLKLFCQSLQNVNMRRVPSGLRGLTAIFKFFVDSINKKLSRPEFLDFDPRARIVGKAVDDLAAAMARGKTDRLPLDEAKTIVNTLLPREGNEQSLFRHLESEGLVSVAPDYRFEEGDWTECVRFTYQRFSDHLIAQFLLDRYFDKENPKGSFSKRKTLGKLTKDEHACWMNRGLLEAFAVQIPELTKKELPDLAPRFAEFHLMREVFVESVIWRDSDSFGDDASRYINEQVLEYQDTADNFWNALIALATTPNHPLNADRLHENLSSFDLADRDAWWSVFLHNNWGRRGAVDRLVEWAWDETDKSVFEDEVIRLAGTTLTWFFTTANRFLRDRATKAMVRLCENRIDVLRKILEMFDTVNDPYVAERLYAVACGCAMRTDDLEALGRLATDVNRLIFESGEPPAHILVRDFARGVIEVAIHRGVVEESDFESFRPPYRSDWPALNVPESEFLASWGEWSDRRDVAKAHLYRSVMKDEDFSRYVIGDLREWSCNRLNTPRVTTRKEMHKQFVESLTERQREKWSDFCTVRRNVEFYRRIEPERQRADLGREVTDKELDEVLAASEREFARTLRKHSKKHKMYPDAIAYETAPFEFDCQDRFDPELARRWMMQAVIDMGWTVERFGEFDRNIGSGGREANKPERIGKKYQWIAYHELLARLSDNFRMYEDKWSIETRAGDGLWNLPIRRDIDPSNLLRKTKSDDWGPHTRTWWFPTVFSDWTDAATEVAWLKKKGNLPSIQQQIEVVNPDDDSEWLTLHGYYNWQQPVPPGEEKYELKRRNIWYMLKSYLTPIEGSEQLLTWGKNQNWMGRWMPESHETYSLQLGEFFWSPAFKAEDCEYHGRHGWVGKSDDTLRGIPTDILVANDEYGRESVTFDCSVDETIHIDLPCRFLVESLGLRSGGVEGHWFNDQGTLIAFDPSVRSKGPRALLVRRVTILEFLKSKQLTLFWTLLGEKQFIGGRERDYKGRLEINGAYVWQNDAIRGSCRSNFNSPNEARRRK